MKEALKQVQTIHAVISLHADGGKPTHVPDPMPSLTEITRRVHADLKVLRPVFSKHLHMGVKASGKFDGTLSLPRAAGSSEGEGGVRVVNPYLPLA